MWMEIIENDPEKAKEMGIGVFHPSGFWPFMFSHERLC
jgi:hypothetical protein